MVPTNYIFTKAKCQGIILFKIVLIDKKFSTYYNISNEFIGGRL